MFAGIDLAMCPNLAVPAEVMQHVAQVESGNNPFAIGVVGGRLQRQPRNLAEAMATARMLERRRYNYSLGIAQVNRANLGHYGLDTYAKAFDRCRNLQAGASILAGCYARARGDWGKAFSCYYSGNFVTGYRDGYVQRVYASMAAPGDRRDGGNAIPLAPGEPARRRTDGRPPGPAPSRLVAIRSVALDMAATAVVPKLARQPVTPAADGHVGRGASAADAVPTLGPPVAARPAGAPADDVFHPIVRGPGDATTASARPSSAQRAVDRADLRQEHADAAFVF